MKIPAGNDLFKWYIGRTEGGRWAVCPPLSYAPDWYTGGRMFDTGAEAIAAFAGGGK